MGHIVGRTVVLSSCVLLCFLIVIVLMYENMY